MPSSATRILVVAHTHWDREWYLPAGRFRQRLVSLVDELLDGAASVRAPFLLDGQAVVLDDYLAVEPGRREQIASLLREGALEAGPWYVLADELIPSGEALVRNLLEGRAALRSLGASSPPVLYCPDSFGHPAALPLLAEGFGLPLIVLWRGYGGRRSPAGDAFRWKSASGVSVLTYHLTRDGYEFGSSLPTDAKVAADRWKRIADALLPRASVGVALLPNGADHHALQPRLDDAIAALAQAAMPLALVQRASLRGFAEALVTVARDSELPEVSDASAGGVELRDSYGYCWTLQGTLATRAHLVRRNASAERLLLRDVEPWVALAATGRPDRDRRSLLHAAWRTLLLCHPHDTLCGCSIDEVARAMAARLDDATSQATGLREDALLDLVGHDRVSARTAQNDWRPVVVVCNATARERSGVAEIEVLRFREHVRVGPGSAPPQSRASDASARGSRPFDPQPGSFSLAAGGVVYQSLDSVIRHDRVESPIAYPSDDLVESERIVAWFPPTPGYGTRSVTIDEPGPLRDDMAARALPASPVAAGEQWLDNGRLRLELDQSGRVGLTSRDPAMSLHSLIGFEDVGDAGDLYTHSARTPLVTEARLADARVVHRGPIRGELHAAWVLSIPRSSDASGRSSFTVETVLHAAFVLDAGADFIQVRIWGVNDACDHRLRIVFRTGIARPEVWADAAFGPVRRRPIVAPGDSAETVPPTAPLARYVSVTDDERGMTLFSDGLPEYEAKPNGDIAVTLLRAVGELSRNDLPERPGHAGWPAPTPEAQALGVFEGRFALLPHTARSDGIVALIERTAEDFLLPLRGFTLRSASGLPPVTPGVALHIDEPDGASLAGALAFSTCKPLSEGQGVVLRCTNLTHRELRARWRTGFDIAAAQRARLDEEPIEELGLAGRDIPFVAGPREVVTIIVRGIGPAVERSASNAER